MTSEEILRNHSESAIRDAIEENHIVFSVDTMSAVPEPYIPEMHRGGEMIRCYTGIPNPMTNGVYALRFDEQDLEKRVLENLEFFRSRKVPHMWWIGPNSSPKEIEDSLVGHGLIKMEWENPAMAVDLRQLDDSRIQELEERSGAEVRRVMREEDMDRWTGVVGAAFGFDELTYKAFQGVFRAFVDKEGSPFILAEVDGEPVGALCSALRAGVVGLYNVGTLEEPRGKGIGQLASLAALFEGRNQGYEIGILSSSEPGFNVYQKLGFKEYFRYRLYVDIPQ